MATVETLDRISKKIQAFGDRVAAKPVTNHEKRVLHSEVDLLSIEIESLLGDKILTPELSIQLMKLITECENFKLSIGSLKRVPELQQNILLNIVLYIDMILRVIAVWAFLAVTSVLLAFPSILIRPFDFFLVWMGWLDPRYQIANIFKCWIATTFLKLSGVQLTSHREEVESLLGKVSCVMCFTHSSTLDAFVLASVIPVRHFSLAKNDLFLIPFFAWSLMAFGGIPVNRENRQQAIRAIAKTARLARVGDCVTVAPEGTRSTTGHLLPFKKGPFYLWETLQQPIIPMVLLGPYDLCPPGHQIPVPGRMYVKFLAPIYPHEAASREDMSRLVRIRMLECIRDSSPEVGAPLTAWERAETVLYLVLFYAFIVVVSVLLWVYVPASETLAVWGITWWMMTLMVLGFVVVVTLLVYVYIMYITYWIDWLLGFFTCCVDEHAEVPHNYSSVSIGSGLVSESTTISPMSGTAYGTDNNRSNVVDEAI